MTYSTIEVQHTSTDALLAVADKIENDPDSWDQSHWHSFSTNESVVRHHSCGSSGCMAGWGAATLPTHIGLPLVKMFGAEPDQLGCIAFGITEDLGAWLFDGGLDDRHIPEKANKAKRCAKVLRHIAKQPEEKRTADLIPRLKKILTTGR